MKKITRKELVQAKATGGCNKGNTTVIQLGNLNSGIYITRR